MQILADTLEHIGPALAGRVERVVLPEAPELGFGALERRILEVLLELGPQSADANRKAAEAGADVFLQPGRDGRATLGAELNAGEAAEAYEFIDTLAREAKKDGDTRPIGQLRSEIYALLVRGAAVGVRGARAHLTITAALQALEGASTQPADVNGFAITPAHLAELLRRVVALGLRTPEGGGLTFALTDADGALIATLSLADLQRRVRRGQGAGPPPATEGYTPTGGQREFIDTRDRTCRMPLCGQRTGWAARPSCRVPPRACERWGAGRSFICAACAAAVTSSRPCSRAGCSPWNPTAPCTSPPPPASPGPADPPACAADPHPNPQHRTTTRHPSSHRVGSSP